MIDAWGNEWNKAIECNHCHHGFKMKAEQGVTYEGIDEHHNPPKFMLGNWEGQLINLCRKCHIEILHPLITQIICKHSNILKKTKSMDWAWKYVPSENKEKCIAEVIEFTNRWLNENGDTDSKTITPS